MVLSYALIVLIASILIGTWFGFLMAAIITIAIIPLRYLQLSGAIPLQTSTDDVIDAVALAAIISFIVTLAWLWNRELKHERDLLEIKVEERTQTLKQAHFEKVEQLYQFVEFGQMATGLFHDILNLVNASSLVNETKAPASQAFMINSRVENFTQAMRRQLNREEAQELFSLAEGVEYVMQLLSYKAIKANMKMVFPQKGNRELVHFGDTFKFHQIVMNLVLNALDAYENSAQDAGSRMIEINIRQKGNFVELSVADHGPGIPEVIREKIFEPFFTTKREGGGMGIGLATVKKFVEKELEGTISLESEEGKGTAFTVRFPMKVR